MYGIRLHPAKDREGTKINLAVANTGILVFQVWRTRRLSLAEGGWEGERGVGSSPQVRAGGQAQASGSYFQVNKKAFGF